MKHGSWVLPDDPELLSAVARVTMRHGQLCYVLRLILKDAGSDDFQLAMHKTRRTSFRCLRKRVQGVIEGHVQDPAKDRLDALLKRAEEATDRRNEVVHDLWTEYDGAIVVRGKKGVVPPPTVDALEELVEELFDIAMRLESSRVDLPRH